MSAGRGSGWGVALALVAGVSFALVAGGAPTRAPARDGDAARTTPPVPPNALRADSLIRAGENHFAELWQLTFGGENAEAYFSGNGRRLVWQATRDDWPCDQIYTYDLATGEQRRVSTGAGRTTCAYWYDGDRRILFASTHMVADTCPPLPDYSQGYVWPLYGYDIFTVRPDGSDLERLTETPGYDAEATLSVDGAWIVFTSVRDGDLELYKMHPDGTDVTRLTHRDGYDGGAFFSRDGAWICFRAYYPKDSTAIADYKALLRRGLVRPTQMDLWVMRADGSDARQVTDDPGASFAPYFTPDGRAIIYSSNRENPRGRNFDLFLVPIEGGTPEPVTREETFDGFPMFSPDGQWLAFSSNRGARKRGDTNLFLARWKP